MVMAVYFIIVAGIMIIASVDDDELREILSKVVVVIFTISIVLLSAYVCSMENDVLQMKDILVKNNLAIYIPDARNSEFKILGESK